MDSAVEMYSGQSTQLVESETKECRANHIIFGTTLGSKEDAAAVARAVIERYMDVPELCHFYLLKASEDSYHYEVQEGGDGIAYMPSVLAMLEGDVTKIVFGTATGRQIAVSLKSDGNLKSVNLSGKDRVIIQDNPDITPVKRMTPYHDASLEIVMWGKLAATIGFALLIGGGTVNQVSTLYEAGYQEIASALPGHRIAQLLGLQEVPIGNLRNLELPITQWPRAVRMAQMSDAKVERMYLTDKNTWGIELSDPIQRREPIDKPVAEAQKSDEMGGPQS